MARNGFTFEDYSDSTSKGYTKQKQSDRMQEDYDAMVDFDDEDYPELSEEDYNKISNLMRKYM